MVSVRSYIWAMLPEVSSRLRRSRSLQCLLNRLLHLDAITPFENHLACFIDDKHLRYPMNPPRIRNFALVPRTHVPLHPWQFLLCNILLPSVLILVHAQSQHHETLVVMELLVHCLESRHCRFHGPHHVAHMSITTTFPL